VPTGFTAIPYGLLNFALVPTPSFDPLVPALPASVVVIPVKILKEKRIRNNFSKKKLYKVRNTIMSLLYHTIINVFDCYLLMMR
jgi:hypothetical protein